MTDKAKPENLVLPQSDEKKTYGCGHEGPVDWHISLSGRELKPTQDTKAVAKCPQCLVDELGPKLTHCKKCGHGILPGEDCIVYKDVGICCMSLNCGPGPLGGLPGTWDGEKYIDGFKTGAIRMF
jgi:hypothetical protein